MMTMQSSYAAGVLAPSLHSRVNLAKWSIGLAQANNMMVHVHGGISNRPGTQYLASTKDNKFARLIPFEYSSTDNLFIELTDAHGRLVINDVPQEFPANQNGWQTNYCTLDGAGDYIQAPNPQRDQIRYRMRFKITGYPVGGFRLIASSGIAIHTNGQVYLARARKVDGYLSEVGLWFDSSGHTIPLNEDVVIEVQKDRDQFTISRPGYWQKTWTSTAYDIPCQIESFQHRDPLLVLSGLEDNFFKNYDTSPLIELSVSEYSGYTDSEGFLFQLLPSVSDSGATDVSDESTSDGGAETTTLTDSTKSWTVDEWIGYYVYNTEEGTSDVIVSNTATVLTFSKDLGTNNDAYEIRQYNNKGCFQDSVDDAYYYNRNEATNVYPLVVDGAEVVVPDVSFPYVEEDLREIRYSQREDVLYLSHPLYPEYALTRYTDHWEFSAVDREPLISAPESLSGAYDGTGSYDVEYVVSAVDIKGEESNPSDVVTVSADASNDWESGKRVLLTWSPVSGVDSYVVYKNSRGYFGYIGTTQGTSFRDDNIAPDDADGPKAYRDPLSGTGNYPKALGIYQQRKVYGGTKNAPQTSWLTQSGTMQNLSVSRPLKDTDSITAQLDSNQVNDILHFVPMKDLIVVTNNGVWTLNSGLNNDVLTPTTSRYDVQSVEGGSYLRPIVSGNTVLLVTNYRDGVRELFYQIQSGGFEGSDLSILSNHLFKNDKIVDWALQKDDSIIWCVMSSGKLCSLTYLREHDIAAWTTHDTVGEFESVAVLPQETRDVTYFVVKRTIEGSTVRYIESLTERLPGNILEDAVFMDASLSYDGAATDSFSGAGHLALEECVVLADGNVIEEITVDDQGEFTLPNEYSKVHIGLAYTSDFETLDVNLEGQDGTLFGEKKVINDVVLSLENTRGIKVGPDEDNLTEMKFRTTEDYDAHTRMYTGKKRAEMTPQWSANGRVHIQQGYPLPVTILSHIPDISD